LSFVEAFIEALVGFEKLASAIGHSVPAICDLEKTRVNDNIDVFLKEAKAKVCVDHNSGFGCSRTGSF
jgi:hypothetical protein